MGEREHLTTSQRKALRLMFVCESGGDGWAVVAAAATHKLGSQAWIHWRTAIALWRRGLVEAEDAAGLTPDEWPEEPRIRLTTKGRNRV